MRILKFAREKLSGITSAVIRFWAVFIPLVCASILISMSAIQNKSFDRQILGFFFAAFVMLLAHVTTERCGKDMITKVLILLAGIASGAGYYLHIMSYDKLGMIVTGRTLTLCFALLVAFMLVPTSGRKTDFAGVFLGVFKAFFTSLFFSGVIFGGIAVIIVAIDRLIVPLDSDIYTHLASIVWVVFAPMLMLSLVPRFADENESSAKIAKATSYPRFLEVLLSYVLVPVLTLYTAVLVVYALKTVAGGVWDTDMLEPLILSYLFAMILLNLLLSGIKNAFAELFRKISPLFAAGIAIFGIISMIIANRGGGLIVGRYYIIAFGIYSVLVGLAMFIRPGMRRGYIGALAVLIAFVCVLPVAGAYDTSLRSQGGIVAVTLEKNNMLKNDVLIPGDNLPEPDKERIYNSVRYLDYIGGLDTLTFLPDNFHFFGDFFTVFGFLPEEQGHDKSINYNYTLKTDSPLSSKGYDYIAYMSYSTFSGENNSELTIIDDSSIGHVMKIITKNGKSTLELTADGASLILPLDYVYSDLKLNGMGDLTLPAEKMTCDFENDTLKIRLIFNNISIYAYDDNENTNASIIILYSKK